MLHHANISKIIIHQTDSNRNYTAIESYDEESNEARPVDYAFASATPMEHINTKHNHPETHPLVQNKSFDIKDPSGLDLFKFHTPESFRKGIFFSASHQNLIVRSGDDSVKFGEVREERPLCGRPHYTVHETSHDCRTLHLKYKLCARSSFWPICCNSSSLPVYDIFHTENEYKSVGKIQGENIEFPLDATGKGKMCIIGAEILINTNCM